MAGTLEQVEFAEVESRPGPKATPGRGPQERFHKDIFLSREAPPGVSLLCPQVNQALLRLDPYLQAAASGMIGRVRQGETES